MDILLPLDKMTIADKLQAMETLWENLSCTAVEAVAPNWHHEVLATREANLNAGKERFSDWETAKEEIRATVK